MAYRSANPFSLTNFMRWLAPYAERFPHAYLFSLSLLALPGVLLLVAIPFTMLVSIGQLLAQLVPLPTEMTQAMGLSIGGWSLILLYTAGLSWKLLRMKLPLPQGLLLKVDNLPTMQDSLQRYHDHFQIRPVQRITITERFEVKVVYTPRFGLPFWTTTTLCIGLPVLQCLSPRHFQVLLAGQIGRHAAPYSRWQHGIYKLRQLLHSYANYFIEHRSWLSWPLALLFRFYRRAYQQVSILLCHWEQLEADRYSLELYSDKEILEAMITATACKQYLQKSFWPGVIKRLQHHLPQQSLPHRTMAESLRHALASGKTLHLLQTAYESGFDGRDSAVPLQARMLNIGYEQLQAPAMLMKNAAHELLGPSQQKIVAFMDKLWLSRNMPRWQQVQKYHEQKQTTLQRLHQQSFSRALTVDELWKQARLTEKLHGQEAALPLYKKLLQKNMQHAKGLYGYGRILLKQGNPTGIKALEQAMKLQEELTPKACLLIFKYLMKRGEKQRAYTYHHRAQTYRQQSAA